MMHGDETDFIIVGGGSAGCVIANRLSADPSARVLLIEAGPVDSRRDFRLHMPSAMTMALASRRYNWHFRTEPIASVNGRRAAYARGKALGGSSTINGFVHMRGNPRDFDGWARERGLDHWAYRYCLPYFKRSECHDHGANAYRGGEGPLKVAKGFGASPLYEVYLEAAMEAGYAFTDDFNGYRQEGFGHIDQTIHEGARMSASRAFLWPIMDRPNLMIVTGGRVSRILIERGRAVGVDYRAGGKVRTARAAREVILCAGAIQSPQILQLSGIGAADRLRAHGIDIVHDLPGVGENLQDHVEVLVQHECPRPVSLHSLAPRWKQPLIGARWLLNRSGLGAYSHFEAGGFVRADDRSEWPDIQYHFLGMAVGYDGSNAARGDGFQVHVSPVRSLSRGHVRLGSADPADAPVIQPNWLSRERDWIEMRSGIRQARDIFARRAFNPFRGRELQPGAGAADNAALDAFIREHALSGFHYCGTCRMGEDEDAVVDGRLRVHGIAGLRVADASVMPNNITGNTNAATMMVAERASDFILGRSLAPEDVPTF